MLVQKYVQCWETIKWYTTLEQNVSYILFMCYLVNKILLYFYILIYN